MKYTAVFLVYVATLASSGCVALNHDRAAMETRAYPLSKAALKILVADVHDIDGGPHSDSLVGCDAWRAKKGPGIFERHGLVPTQSSSSIYDGEALLITNTAENHRIIQNVLGIIEDTLRLREVEVDIEPIDPFIKKADEK